MGVVKLGDVARESRLKWTKSKQDVPIVGLEHLIPNEIRFDVYDINTDNTFSKRFVKGQVLFGRRRAYQRKAAVAEFDGICSGDITVIEAIEGKIVPELLPFIVQTPVFFDYANRGSAGSLSPRVKWEHLLDYEFELPSLEEQKVLADKLWAAYRLKEAYKKLLVATDEMVKSQFIEMFKDLPVNGTISDLTEGTPTSVKKTYGYEDLIEYIDISSIDSTSKTVLETSKHFVGKAPSRAQQCVKNGDILVSTVRPVNRNIAVIDNDIHNLVASTGFCVLRPKEGYRDYLLSIVTSDLYTEKMCDKASGGLYPAVNNSDVLNYGIHIPDEGLANRVSIIYKQADKSKFGDFKSQFIEMFGDPMTNTKAWFEFGYIGNYTQIVLGTTPNSKNSSYWNGEIKWITPVEMTEESYYIYDTERHLTEEGLKAANLTLLPCRSVLFSTRAPIGKVGLAGSPMCCNQGFKNFVCGDQLNPVYLYYSLIFKREYLVSLGTGTTFKELSKKAVENLKIAVPPLILQNKFEEIYQQADKSKSIIQKALVYLNDIQSVELGKIA